jgi:hypothetical protein
MWQTFHAFRHLADAGKVKPLSCPDCDSKLVTTLNMDDPTDSVWLWCPMCDQQMKPGLDVIERVKAVVAEHTAD